MTYDKWKTTEPEPFQLLNKAQLRIELAEIEKEIAWNERRLENLVFDDVERKLTEALVADLRQDRQRLLGMLSNA